MKYNALSEANSDIFKRITCAENHTKIKLATANERSDLKQRGTSGTQRNEVERFGSNNRLREGVPKGL